MPSSLEAWLSPRGVRRNRKSVALHRLVVSIDSSTGMPPGWEPRCIRRVEQVRTKRAHKQPRWCAFCAGGNLSKEHIWPSWAAEHLPDAPVRSEMVRLQRGPRTTTDNLSRPGSLKHKKLRVVCETCNNGWMSVLENDTKRIVLPMMTGQSLFLDASAQKLLARWIALKVIIIEQARPEDAVITAPERVAFMEHQTMPEGLSIELAYCGKPPWDTAMAHHSAILFPKLPPDVASVPRDRKNIQTTTFGIGKLVAHCIARSSDAINLFEMVTFSKPLLTLWPLTGAALIWPPKPFEVVEVDRVASRLDTLTKSGKVNYVD